MLPHVNIIVDIKPVTRHYMLDNEQGVILALAGIVKPRVVVEVGVNIGLTAQALLEGVESIEKYYGIDVDPDYRFEIAAQQIEYPGEPGRLVKGDPRFELILRGNPLPTAADFIFIDGDHGHNAVMADSKWAAEIVRPGGMVVWHDYLNPGVQVTDVLEELQSSGRDIRRINGTWLAFERH